jgi:hypothetical protein
VYNEAMPPLTTLPRRTAARALSRADAFKAHGVSLKYPARSWSGVRWVDGVVVIALRDTDVRVEKEGCSCLLWTPVIEGATSWADSPSKQERLEHCRLAVLQGGAEGIMVCGEAALVKADRSLALHVEKRRNEYWATWGWTARVLLLRTPAKAPAAYGTRVSA